MKILVAEPLAAGRRGVVARAAGLGCCDLESEEYEAHLADSDALIVRSAVKVTKDVLAKAPNLRVIGRAGVGVDNVDLEAATAAGVLVMNTPGGNAISVAEHTLALMLSMARSVPQACTSTQAGKWEKKKFLGNELRGKTLGVVGLGKHRARSSQARKGVRDEGYRARSLREPAKRGRAGSTAAVVAGALQTERLHHAARRTDARDGPHAERRRIRTDEARRADCQLRARRIDRLQGA